MRSKGITLIRLLIKALNIYIYNAIISEEHFFLY